PAAAIALDKTEAYMLRGISKLTQRLARQVSPEAWQKHARRLALAAPAGKAQERVLAPWLFTKTGDPAALAGYLTSEVDFTSAGPHTVNLPPWMEETL